MSDDEVPHCMSKVWPCSFCGGAKAWVDLTLTCSACAAITRYRPEVVEALYRMHEQGIRRVVLDVPLQFEVPDAGPED